MPGKNEHDNNLKIFFSPVQNRQQTGGFGFTDLNNVILHQRQTNTMRKTATCLLVCMAIYHCSNSQNIAVDTSQTLGEVIVKAYEQNQSLRKVPAAINKVTKSSLERFSNTNILPALNSTPGVRMEERSPGSYRMNIRGSTTFTFWC